MGYNSEYLNFIEELEEAESEYLISNLEHSIGNSGIFEYVSENNKPTTLETYIHNKYPNVYITSRYSVTGKLRHTVSTFEWFDYHYTPILNNCYFLVDLPINRSINPKRVDLVERFGWKATFYNLTKYNGTQHIGQSVLSKNDLLNQRVCGNLSTRMYATSKKDWEEFVALFPFKAI